MLMLIIAIMTVYKSCISKESDHNKEQISIEDDIHNLLNMCEKAYKTGRLTDDIYLAVSECFYNTIDAEKCRDFWSVPDSPENITFELLRIKIIDENKALGSVKYSTWRLGKKETYNNLHLVFKRKENDWKLYEGFPVGK